MTALSGCPRAHARARSLPNSTATSSARARPSARSRSRCATATGAKSCPRRCGVDIIPKNILMIGPTGVGKTEIARRLANLAGAPFIKVEATKYTEVGYVGRDVESMVRDLAEAAIRMVRDERRADVVEAADRAAVERVIDLLHPETRPPTPSAPNPFAATFGSIFGNNFGGQNAAQSAQPVTTQTAPPDEAARIRDSARADVLRGFYDVRLVEIEVEEAQSLPIGMIGGDMMNQGGGDIGEMLGGLMPKKRAKKRVTDRRGATHLRGRRRGQAHRHGRRQTRSAAARRAKTASSSSTRSTRLRARAAAAGPTCRAKACSATSCRSSKARRSTPSTASSRPITSCSSRPARST